MEKKNTCPSIDTLKGIGPKTREAFFRAGIYTAADLLSYFPRAYETLEPVHSVSSLKEGTTAAVLAAADQMLSVRYVRNLAVITGTCSDSTGTLSLVWYRMPYLKRTVVPGKTFVFRGTVQKKGKRLLLEQPAIYSPSEYEELTRHLQPVYPLVRGLTRNMVQKAVRQALTIRNCLDSADEDTALSNFLNKDFPDIPSHEKALEQIHFPPDEDTLSLSRRRLAFEEFFYFLLQLYELKEHRGKIRSSFVLRPAGCIQTVLDHLSYSLTGDQQKVWQQLENDLCSDHVMSRLIQGDVGSGKTILAVLSLLMCAENGVQAALMAPTEVLAIQHAREIERILKENGLPWKSVLLSGSMTASQKREAHRQIREGEASITIGTHALIQESVEFRNLALVITDEQHRFGVRQREMFAQKGRQPHMLVMSATPIPRTLAVILYGDLDISVIREMPAGRLPIKNCVVGTDYRPSAYRFIQNQISQGRQAYVICPMAQESEYTEAENVVDYSDKLRAVFPDSVCIETLYGKMSPEQKNEIMGRFLSGQIQILVSTTVVEVGVNVPNATVMMIEDAQRFGLAQLHQLRGRVGRGNAQSYCIFIQTKEGDQTKERLEILGHSNDGFEIASKDLKLRGPGDLFGFRQSGLMNFELADIYADADLLQRANEAVKELMEEDRYLDKPEHASVRQKLEQIRMQNQTVSELPIL